MCGAVAPASGGIRQAVDAVCRVFSWLAGAITLLIMIMLAVEVVTRTATGGSVLGTIEISEIALAFVVFLGVAQAQRVRAHVNTNLVTSRMPVPVAVGVRVVGLLAAAVVLVWTAWASAERALDSVATGESRFGITEVPIWPARVIIPVGLVLLAVQVVFTAYDAVRNRGAASERAG